MTKQRTIVTASLRQKLIVATVCVASMSGCATTNPNPGNGGISSSSNPIKDAFASDDPCSNNARNTGILVGALVGAFLGNQNKHSNTSRIVGAATGAFIGGWIGNDLDNRRCELSKIAKKNNLDMQFEEIKAAQVNGTLATAAPQSQSDAASAPPTTRSADTPAVGLKVILKDDGRQFQSGSDELSTDAQTYFAQIADQYSYEAQKKRLLPTSSKDDAAAVEGLKEKRILLTGHTDDIGSSARNADLSERRAKTVAKIFRERGINDEHIFFQGAGETLPIADNRTEEGRARNRRVEIIDLSNGAELRAYLASRKPAAAYYRNAPDKPTDVAAAANTSVPALTIQKATKGKVRADATPTSPQSREKQHIVPVSHLPVLDFGGVPVETKIAAVNIGSVASPGSGFSAISPAHADEPVTGSCLQDRPRISHGVKSLKNDQEYGIDDYMPGLYGTSWADMVNGNLVALTHVTVLRDGGLPATRPTLLVYRDYDPKAKAKPSITDTPDVNVYRGDKAVLYRVFSASAPIRCLDVVIPYEKRTEAQGSNLYYDLTQKVYVANFNPKLAK